MSSMKIEDFGFQPVMGKEYVVTFTKDGELLSTSIYNGSPLPSVSFPDNSKISLSITDKETGKNLLSSEFISYNGKLYKSVFNLPLKNTDTNKNANIYIKDLHYDLTTGSVLVQVQGFSGDNYKLVVSDATVKHQVMAMPIELKDDMYYSIPTELVQGNTFEVLLQDQHGKSIDIQQFTAPISTDWRHTDTVENGSLQLDEEPIENQEQVDTSQQTGELVGQVEEPSNQLADMAKSPVIIGSAALILVLLIVLIIRMMRRKKAKEVWTEIDPEDIEEDDLEQFEDVEEEYSEEGREEDESSDHVEDGVENEEDSSKNRKDRK